jgi:spermidine/putrescine transport system substrate-binding protein
MDKKDFLSRLKDGVLSRRQALEILRAAGVGVVTMPLMAPRARAEDQVTYFTWSGYDVPEFFPKYVEKHGANPNMPIFADEEEAFQKLRAGFFTDVAHPCSGRISRWRSVGLLQPIDTGRLSHWPDVFDYLKSANGANADGQQWFVPVDWGNTSVVYRTDLVDVKEDSWTILWDQRYKGKLSIGVDITDTAVIVALLTGAKDPYDPTDAEIAAIRAKMTEQKPLLRFYWSDETTMEQALTSGEIVASSAWNGAVARLKAAGVPVAYMKPKEGILCWACGLTLIAGAKEVDKAYDLMDAMLDPAAGQWLVTANGYGHSNKKTFDLVDDATLAELGLPKDPTEMLSSGIFSRENKKIDVLQKMFEEVQAS